MDLPNNIRARLVLEVLVNVNDFDDFKEYQLNQAFKNMHTAITSIPSVAADGGAASLPDVAPVTQVLVSEKCALRLKVALIAYHYYASIGGSVIPANMNYTNVLKGFNIEYVSLITLSKETNPSVLLLYKNQTPLKQIESFKYCLYRTYCLHHCPILYVV